MNRRSAIKQLLLASGGVLTIPSWLHSWTKQSIGELNTTFTDYEIAIISSIADTIIPSNGTIGAISVGVDTFLVGLISRCYPDDFVGEVRINLELLDTSAINTHQNIFTECSKSNREELLLALSTSRNENDKSFFKFMKQQTIRGFETSQEVLVNYRGYVLMPGFYDGNVDVEA